jgi:hypothetical protein
MDTLLQDMIRTTVAMQVSLLELQKEPSWTELDALRQCNNRLQEQHALLRAAMQGQKP